MPMLFLLKPRKASKSKDYIKALKLRLGSWKSRDNEDLIFEATATQSRLNHINKPKRKAELLKYFVTMMEKGNVNGVVKLLANSLKSEISH